MQEILVATTNNKFFDEAKSVLSNRSLLYNKDTKKLYIKYNNELVDLSTKVDNMNIVIDKDGKVALSPDISCKSFIVQPSKDAPKVNGNKLIGKTLANRNILLLMKQEETALNTMAGEVFELGTGISSSYHMSLSSNGSRSLNGSSTFEKKAVFVKCVLSNSDVYFGIKFPNDIPADIYFNGYDTRTTDVPESVYDKILETIELVDESNKVSDTVVVSVPSNEVTWDFLTVPDGFLNLNTEWTNKGGNDNKNVNLGDDLFVKTASGTFIDTNTSKLMPDGKTPNIGGICFCNTDTKMPSLELRIAGPCDVEYYVVNRDAGKKFPWVVKTLEGKQVSKAVANGNEKLVKGAFTDNEQKVHNLYFTHKEQSALWLLKVKYNVHKIIDLIDTLPDTTRTGEPNNFKLAGFKLTLADLQYLATKCNNYNKLLHIDLSDCEVDASLTKITEPIFQNCSGIFSFKLPRGIKSISSSLFTGCVFLSDLYFNQDLEEISSRNFIDFTRVRTLKLPKAIKVLSQSFLDSNTVFEVYFHKQTDPANLNTLLPWGVFNKRGNASNIVDVYTFQEMYDAIANEGSWKVTYVGLESLSQMTVYKPDSGDYGE